jgi:Protein of unknwon function (DUF3008)
MKINQVITEKSVSKQQQKFMGMVYAAKKGEKPASPAVAKTAAGMSKSDAKDFAKTKHKGLPNKVGEATGDPMGTVSTTPDASGKVKIKTPTGTEIETTKDALLPGAKPGTVQMKPDAAGDQLKPGTQVVSAEAMGGEEDDGDPPIDSAESYKAWLQKSAAKSGLSPEDSAGLMNVLVTEPDGSIDMDATMVKTAKEFANFMPQLLEIFTEWIGLLEKAKADTAQWSTYTPEERKSVDDAIADGKAQLPAMQAQIKQMQAQMPQLDQAMANRKTAGNNMKIPATAPMEELDRIKELSGLKGEDISFNGVTQHANGDMSYNQGPLSMRQNKDGSSDMTANIGNTTARVQQNPIGVKTLTAQGPEADSINSVDASADRKGVDPKKFAAFQKQNPAAVKESPELTAMLSIAGLR